MIQNTNMPKISRPAPLPEKVVLEVDGAAGTGKTHFFGTVGKGGRVLMFDMEGGSVTYSSPAYLADPDATEPENIDIVRFDDVTDAKDMVFRVESALDYIIRTRELRRLQARRAGLAHRVPEDVPQPAPGARPPAVLRCPEPGALRHRHQGPQPADERCLLFASEVRTRRGAEQGHRAQRRGSVGLVGLLRLARRSRLLQRSHAGRTDHA